MKVLTRDDFTSSPAPTTVEPVAISADEQVFVRVLSGARREVYLDLVRTVRGLSPEEEKIAASARLVAASLCDAEGAYYWPRLEEATQEELHEIGNRPWYWLTPIVDRAGFLNGFSSEGQAAAKNGYASPSDNGNTGSPAT